jgi:nucleoid-associated protein YgaU
MGWIGDRDITDTPVYVVKPGDTLWDIAANQLGNGLRYKEIAELNGLNDADYIYQGQELKLPIN